MDALALVMAMESSVPDEGAAPCAPVAAHEYGALDSFAFTLLVGGGSDLDGASYAQGIAEVSWFVAEGLGLGIYGSGISVSQPVDDANGGGFGVDVRWHFLREAEWSLYAELGCGVQYTDQEVPQNGSDTNFAPWAGGGFRHQLDATASFMVGVQWFHQSNARTSESNPGRNSIGAYIGLSWSL